MTIKMKERKGRSPNDKQGNSDDEQSRVQIFARQMLVTRIFAASYIGRFYVESLNAYRDVIKVYKEECDIMRDLKIVKQRIEDFYEDAVWSSITGPSDNVGALAGHCVWVRLENVAFGSYWFMIEDLAFSESGEVVIKVKVIRSFDPTEKVTQKDGGSNIFEDFKDNIKSALRDTITWTNVKESAKFLFLLSMTIVTTLLYGLQYLGDYSIRFFREFNNFVKVATPIFIRFFDLISKAIGGFYILIAMMWRGGYQQGPPPYRPYQAALPPPQRKALGPQERVRPWLR